MGRETIQLTAQTPPHTRLNRVVRRKLILSEQIEGLGIRSVEVILPAYQAQAIGGYAAGS